MRSDAKKVRVIIFNDVDASWVAQCLELDIAAHGSDIETAKERLSLTIGAELDYCRAHGRELEESVRPAPSDFLALYEKASSFVSRGTVESDGQRVDVEYAVAA